MSAPSAQTTASANAAGLQAVMSIENEALAATDIIALRHIAVNRPRAVIQAPYPHNQSWIEQHHLFSG